MTEQILPPADDYLDVWGLTHVGRIRENNEDQFFVATMRKEMDVMQTSLTDRDRLANHNASRAYLIIVADGVGGVAGGELASNLAVETVTELVSKTAGCYYNLDVDREHLFLEQLEQAVRDTHTAVTDAFGGEGQGPATTLTLAAVVWPRTYVVHIGDSRAYYLHDAELRQLTRDQTVAAMLLDEGVLTETQAESSKLSNVLASAIGGQIDPSVGLVDLDDGDTLLLCTDGLTKHVPDQTICDILVAAPDARTACEQLQNAALEGGGSDNITVVVARKREG